MKELYGKIFREFSENDELAAMAHFVAIKGKCYEENDIRLMIIGRAPNGWLQFSDYSNETSFGTIAESQFWATDRMTHANGDIIQDDGWLDNRNGALYSFHCPSYCVSNKAFWSYSKRILDFLMPIQNEQEIWPEQIAWSNLYKVSPVDIGNPAEDVMQRQQKTCIEILKKELDILKPTHILLITGYEWFEPFAEVFDNVQSRGERNINVGKNKNKVYVEGTATYGKAKVVIACRPEMRDQTGYVQEVVKYLQN